MIDHDLLIRMDEKLDGLKHGFDNHLRHHWGVSIVLLTITLGAIVSLIIALL